MKSTTPEEIRLLDKGTYRGYKWEVGHNTMGFRVGYVHVPWYHPWNGLSYDDIYKWFHVNVHGGLTYSRCYSPLTGTGHWVIGFDCGHYGDGFDPTLPVGDAHLRDSFASLFDGPIRTTSYCKYECHKICDYARAAFTFKGFLVRLLIIVTPIGQHIRSFIRKHKHTHEHTSTTDE